MEKVSVVVPMYNVERYVERCIASLLSQTYPLIEIIAISDAFPDRSVAIADIMAAKNKSGGGQNAYSKRTKRKYRSRKSA